LLSNAWPVFVVGLVLFCLQVFLHKPTIALLFAPDEQTNFRAYLRSAGLRSIWVGILEELVFRWLFFFGCMVFWSIANYLCYYLLFDNALPAWFFSAIALPVADFATFHKLHTIFFAPQYTWIVGAAILSANGKFRKGHAYQGFLGWVWAWYGGIFLFLILFKSGIFACILVHALYDVFISSLYWLWMIFCRRNKVHYVSFYLPQIQRKELLSCLVCGCLQYGTRTFARVLDTTERTEPVRLDCGHSTNLTFQELHSSSPVFMFLRFAYNRLDLSAWNR
jgi:hypothetical protein